MTLRVVLALVVSSQILQNIDAFAQVDVQEEASAPDIVQTGDGFEDKFRQLEPEIFPPTGVRLASGRPGPDYWQQEVDYTISVRLDEDARRLSGTERIKYVNNSPDSLEHLWIHLDQNVHNKHSVAELADDFVGLGRRGPMNTIDAITGETTFSLDELRRQQAFSTSDYGFKIHSVSDSRSRPLAFTIVGTKMRVDYPRPIESNESYEFTIEFEFNLIDEEAIWGRSGFEHFPDDPHPKGNDVFLLAQWFPRVAAYTDYEGWTNKELLGRGEFTMEFGDYDVSITVPADHVVAATGVLANPKDVLSEVQRKRLETAKRSDEPVFIVTQDEAELSEQSRAKGTKTWRFKAQNVRDFAWASSRKYMWDAMSVPIEGKSSATLAMSFYTKECQPLWSEISTKTLAHGVSFYSKHVFPYPYPTIQSVSGPVGGMEYPMIAFNKMYTNLNENGERTYTPRQKYELMGLTMHEAGHIWFPMIINSDERQWAWMDEGLTSFLDKRALLARHPHLPWGRTSKQMAAFMTSKDQTPIMTQADSLLQFQMNSYYKPAAALLILREIILGPNEFDAAFKAFARDWRFKRPMPSDFFRSMEEHSGVDLDWFWRGWFFTTDHVDISLDSITLLSPPQAAADDGSKRSPTKSKGWREATRQRALNEQKQYYVFEFSNIGGLVMPIVLELTYSDGSKENLTFPAEIWRRTPTKVRKLLQRDKSLVKAIIDPNNLTADANMENNSLEQIDISKWRIAPADATK